MTFLARDSEVSNCPDYEAQSLLIEPNIRPSLNQRNLTDYEAETVSTDVLTCFGTRLILDDK